MTPRPLSAGRAEIATAIAQAPGLAVLSDFDGTLARIQRDPARVELSPATRAALESLTQRGALVGVISGRGLADIRARVGLRGIGYSGCHGYLLEDSRGHVLTLATREEQARLAAATRTLTPRLRRVRGIRLEKKEIGLAVHYRGASQASIRRAHALLEVALANPGLRLLPGSKVWELLPGGGVDKLTAIRLLLVLEQHLNSLVIYIGDDVTDERVFAQVRGPRRDCRTWITIAVGKTTDTTADYFVESPADVRRFLGEIPYPPQ
jgi:alpha,alpha-trehalase